MEGTDTQTFLSHMYEDNIDVGKDQLSLSLFFFLISLHTLSHVRFTLDAIAANII